MNSWHSIESGRRQLRSAFTLVEATISIAVAGISIGGILYGFVLFGRQTEWSSCSTAAQSMAMRGLEQTRAAKWDPLGYPSVDEVVSSNFPAVVANLDIPLNGANAVSGTNTTTITTVSPNSLLKMIQVSCVWSYPRRGLFTNTVVTYRAPNQ